MNKPNRIPLTGTKYYKVSLASKDAMLICVVSTPLTKEELERFIEKRVGYTPGVHIFESPLTEVKGELYGKIVGLSTFEGLLEPFVPEEILEERTMTLVRTNKTHGDFIYKKEEEREV